MKFQITLSLIKLKAPEIITAKLLFPKSIQITYDDSVQWGYMSIYSCVIHSSIIRLNNPSDKLFCTRNTQRCHSGNKLPWHSLFVWNYILYRWSRKSRSRCRRRIRQRIYKRRRMSSLRLLRMYATRRGCSSRTTCCSKRTSGARQPWMETGHHII